MLKDQRATTLAAVICELLVAIIVVASGVIQNTTASNSAVPKITDIRLPIALYPEHYNLEIQTYITGSDPAHFKYKGSVKIWMRCDVATDNITLHMKALTIEESSIRFYGDFSGYSGPAYLTWTEDKDRQFLILKLDGKTEVGKRYVVTLDYTAPLKSDLSGLYLSTYKRDGQPVYLATTHFEPTDARKAFPCFDEPAIKSTFNITLVRPSHLISISNMPIIDNSTTFVDGDVTFVKDVYMQTRKMPTYLLAFIVCDFIYSSKITENGLLFRAWSRPEANESTEFALDFGTKALVYYEEFFNISFPLPKQDIIAVPDFPAGAMENWGLIIYREVDMLYTQGVSSEANKERVALVVSHELAHMWFGDLVSPSWWDDLWLNEGFATFVEYLGMDHVHPEWKMFDVLVINELQKALSFDGLVSSHPLYVPVGHPDEITEIFDAVSYSKGASLIRMMRQFVGYKTFRRGMNLYLISKQYDVANHNDLWSALTQQASLDNKRIDVKEVMDTWTLQMNYPLVTVTRDSSLSNTVRVQQQRYLQNYNTSEQGKFLSPFNYTWNIPLTLTTSSELNFEQTDENVYWMWRNESSKLIKLGSLSPYDWIICNTQQNGYYRVNYENSNWLALAQQLKDNHRVIPTINRAQLINDAWNLVRSKFLDLDIAFSIIDYLEKEKEFVPWQAARLELIYVSRMLSSHSIYGSFQKFMQQKLRSSYQSFGLDNTGSSHTEVAARQLIANQACTYEVQECLDAASSQYKKWMENGTFNPIDLNLRSVVYCQAVAAGGAKEWSFALEMYKRTDHPSERKNLLFALSCPTKLWILNSYLRLTLDPNSPVRKQDISVAFTNVADNPYAQTAVWNFFRENYDQLKAIFAGSIRWASVIDSVTKYLSSVFELEELIEFKARHEGNFGSGERAIHQAIEKVQSNVQWVNDSLPVISSWLLSKGF
ncbi:hypothetical protein Btru_039144 [Bulinus truncatus]|nr:hypothetical protein Btru_039144 [Bulinus truncatus]